MKNTLNYIFKNWRIADFIILSIYITINSIFVAKLKLSFIIALSGFLLMFGMIYLQKKTLLGYIVALLCFAFFSWQLYVFGLMGDFLAVLIFLCPLIIWKIVQLVLKKQQEKETFNKWDYLTLFGSLAVMGYPTYLLLIQLNSGYPLFQTLSFLIMLVICYLQIKNHNWSKYLAIILIGFELMIFVLQIAEMEFSVVTLALGLLLLFVHQIYCFATDMHKLRKFKKINKDNTKEVKTEENV